MQTLASDLRARPCDYRWASAPLTPTLSPKGRGSAPSAGRDRGGHIASKTRVNAL